MGFGVRECLQTLPGAIQVLDGLNMSPNGARGSHFVSQIMILERLLLSQSTEKPDMCLVGSQDMCLVESQDMCLVESQDTCLVESQAMFLGETQDMCLAESQGCLLVLLAFWTCNSLCVSVSVVCIVFFVFCWFYVALCDFFAVYMFG